VAVYDCRLVSFRNPVSRGVSLQCNCESTKESMLKFKVFKRSIYAVAFYRSTMPTTRRSLELYQINKMQSETADFVAGAATWRIGRNIRVVLDSGLVVLLYENVTSSTKPEVHDILPAHEDRAMAVSNVYEIS